MTGYEPVTGDQHRHRDRSYSQAARLGWWTHSHPGGDVPHDDHAAVLYAGDDGNGPPILAEERAGAEVVDVFRGRCAGCGESLTTSQEVAAHECDQLPGALSFILIGAGWLCWVTNRHVRAVLRRMTRHHDMPV